jgi:protein SCO1/2
MNLDTKVFRRSLQWTAIGLCVLFVAFYAWQYYVVSYKLPEIGKAPDFVMTDTAGQTQQLSKWDNKVRLVYFFFASCPNVCPPTTNKLAKLQNKLVELGYDRSLVQFVSITVDPEFDTPQRLLDFAKKNGAELDNWSYLTSDLKYTKEVAESFDVGIGRDKDNRLLHNNQITLIDQKGIIRQIYGDPPNQAMDIEQILNDIEKLL